MTGITKTPKVIKYPITINRGQQLIGVRTKFDPVDGKYVGDKGPIDSYHVFNMSGNYSFNQD